MSIALDLAKLNKEDPRNLPRVLQGIGRAVEMALKARPLLIVLGDTARGERVRDFSDRAIAIFTRMRHEPQPSWPLAKCLDMLPQALQNDLDGKRWEPPAPGQDRVLWVAPQN